jgi:phenylacetate-CoA ligase
MYSNLYSAIRLFSQGGFQRQGNLKELEHTQWLSRAELETLQFRKIQRVIRYAFEHVPYYRDRYTQEDIHPEDIKSYKDFQALPFLTKDDINNHLDDLVSPEFISKLHMSETGGSTGKPTRFFTESQSSNWGGSIQTRCRGWYGVKQGERIAWVWGALRDTPDSHWTSRLKATVKRHRYLNAFFMTREKMREFAEMLIRWKPTMIRAYPSALQIFATYLQEHNLSSISPKLIETTSERLTSAQRRLFENVFHCQIADCYSSRELYEMAYQCPHGGRHVCETVYLEIVSGNQVVKLGQPGEVVVTSLIKFGMPFIRYKNEDMAIYEPGECSCGRGLPILREIIGRKSDFITTPEGNLVDAGFFELLLSNKPEIYQFQVHQTDTKHIEINLVCKKPINTLWFDNIRKELRERLGEDMKINFNIVDNIILSPAGKYHYVISEIKPAST